MRSWTKELVTSYYRVIHGKHTGDFFLCFPSGARKKYTINDIAHWKQLIKGTTWTFSIIFDTLLISPYCLLLHQLFFMWSHRMFTIYKAWTDGACVIWAFEAFGVKWNQHWRWEKMIWNIAKQSERERGRAWEKQKKRYFQFEKCNEHPGYISAMTFSCVTRIGFFLLLLMSYMPRAIWN